MYSVLVLAFIYDLYLRPLFTTFIYELPIRALCSATYIYMLACERHLWTTSGARAFGVDALKI